MPWYPKARKVDVGRDKGRPITPVRINYHTAVVNRDDLDGQARNKSMAYPHFMVGRNGQVTQYQDTSLMARADLDGNPSTVSIETWDGYPNGYPGYWKHDGDVPPWTDAQVNALIELTVWLLEQHKSIPARLATDSCAGPSSRGLSWHRLGCDSHPKYQPGFRVPGGVRYSLAAGKLCPGDRRIAQIRDRIYPAVTRPTKTATILPLPVPKEDTMFIVSAAGSAGTYLLREGGPLIPLKKAADITAFRDAGVKDVKLPDWASLENLINAAKGA